MISSPSITTMWSSSSSDNNNINNKQQRSAIVDADIVEESRRSPRKSAAPTPVLVKAFQDLVGDNGTAKPASMVAAAALTLALLFNNPLDASAAMSGGRMGGSFSAPSQSRSYGGGGGRGYSRGYSSGYYSRPSVTIAPTIVPFGGGYSPFYSPFAFPRPFFFGGPGVITYARGPSFFDLLIVGGIGFFILNAVRAASSGISLTDNLASWSDETVASALGTGTSVAQITVALDVPNRDDRNSILSVLDRLADTAQTDSRVGIQNLSSQVALELLRRKSSIVSASTRYRHFKDRNQALRDYNSLSVKERAKFEQETVSRFGGVNYGQPVGGSGSSSSGQATVAVVTIMIAIDGDSTKLPQIGSINDVEEALRKIAADAKVDSCLQSAEILWTPEDRSETLSMRDVVADYPQLRSV